MNVTAVIIEPDLSRKGVGDQTELANRISDVAANKACELLRITPEQIRKGCYVSGFEILYAHLLGNSLVFVSGDIERASPELLPEFNRFSNTYSIRVHEIRTS